MHETHPGVQVSCFSCDIFLELIIVALQFSAKKAPMSLLVETHLAQKSQKVLFGVAHNRIETTFYL